MKEITAAWLEVAFLDLASAERLLEDAFLTPVVAFHAQQCLEKALKAILEEKSGNVPKIHNLLKLYELASEQTDFTCDLDFLQQLNDVYIDARYPGDLGLLPDGKPSREDVQRFYDFAHVVYQSVRTMLEADTRPADDAGSMSSKEVLQNGVVLNEVEQG